MPLPYNGLSYTCKQQFFRTDILFQQNEPPGKSGRLFHL